MRILEQILAKRGIKTKKEVTKFVNPPKPETFTTDDFGLTKTGLKKAVDRIQEAINENAPIFIHGDYDVDGICSTAVLWETIYFNLSYQNVHPFIPLRINHGYGLTLKSIEEIQRQRTATLSCYDDTNHRNKNNKKSLLITLDCGITAFEEVNYANSLGFEVIILDHHEKDKKLPKAFAILHSIKVCSTALAWFLAQILQGHTESRSHLLKNPAVQRGYTPQSSSEGGQVRPCEDLDLVALATIADLEPLTGLNRSFAKYGLEGLNHTERIGLQELIKIAGIENRKISTYEVGWMLGPRLNAMGRLESALDSLRLLCTRDRERARELAQKLNEANYQRQEMTKKAVEQARQMVLRSHLLRGDAEGGSFTPDDESGAGVTSQENTSHQLIILSHSDWHEGIIGLIASKMTEEFGKPTLAISQGETISKGSARSIEGFNLVENLRLHQDLLINVGGHPMAAGLTIETAKITEFSNRFSDNLSQASQETSQGLPLQMQGETLKNKKAVPQQKFKVDLNLPFEKIDFNLYQELQQLEPFGLGNPQPLFQTNNLIINDLRLVGKEGQHLKLKVGDDKASILDSIGFSLGFWANEVKVGDKINLIYYLEKDDFNGNQKVQLRIKSIEKNSLQK